MVAANKADIVLTYQPALLLYIAKDLPLVRFATLIDRPLNCFITLQGGAIAGFKGKRIGYSGTEIERIIFSTMLEKVGLGLSDVRMINVNFNLVTALLAKKVDGFIGGMRNFEPLVIESFGGKGYAFYPEEYGFPKYDELILVAHKDKVNDPRFVKFVAALKMGTKYLKENPEKSWKKFIKIHPELNSPLNKKSWLVTLPYFAADPAKLDWKRYQQFGQFMLGKKWIKRLPEMQEYAVELK
ncbi:MAG: ABC transporter substrate-binding protein, partial [Gammaproteobacteria bacterium]|nr:ABC transporter substrate-binding protein [Gammaproteobacteria bacterium]